MLTKCDSVKQPWLGYHSRTYSYMHTMFHYVWQSTSVCKSRRVSDVSRHGHVSALSATYAPPPPTFSVSYSTYVRSFVHSYCGLADERTTWFLSRCPLSLSLLSSLCATLLPCAGCKQGRRSIPSFLQPTLSSTLSMDDVSFRYREYIRELFPRVFLANDENRILFASFRWLSNFHSNFNVCWELVQRVRTQLQGKNWSKIALENIFLWVNTRSESSRIIIVAILFEIYLFVFTI